MKTKRCGSGKFKGNSMIRMIVGRLHVGTPENEVVEYVRSRFKPKFWADLPAADKKAIECEAKRAHAENFQLYRDVARGRF